MNELQSIELSILKDTIAVIEELGLKYFLVCGTALGAAKYKGFIPWDDDVDIGLPREDYRVFCEKAQDYLPSHLFLQNHRTDKSYPLIFSKVRHSGTTYIEKSMAHINMHHGAYIDVFPLDGYPMDKKQQKRLERKKMHFHLSMLCCFATQRSRKTKTLAAVQKAFFMNRTSQKRIAHIERELSRWALTDSELVCNHGNWQGTREYAPIAQYSDGIYAEFEGLRVRIPELYDEYLSQKYGDWRTDLPKEQQIGHHYYEICDLSRPYTHYVQRLSNGKIRIKDPKD